MVLPRKRYGNNSGRNEMVRELCPTDASGGEFHLN